MVRHGGLRPGNLCSIGIGLLLVACTPQPRANPGPTPATRGWHLRYSQTFDTADALQDFQFTDESVWYWADDFGGVMGFREGSNYAPPYRSPLAMAMLKNVEVDRFVLEAKVRQTGREYAHRDLCFFFSWQTPARFGYVHLASRPDERAHNIFTVNEAPRAHVAPVADSGITWSDGWHDIRLERLISGGDLDVFFDGRLVLTGQHDDFQHGWLGFGSFDDSGQIDQLTVWTP